MFPKHRLAFRNVMAAAAMCSGLLLVPTAYAVPLVLTPPAVSPKAIPAGEAANVRVAFRITDPDYIAGSAFVQRVDAAGKVLAKLGTLRDDGLGGDDEAGDRVYTAQIELTLAKHGDTANLQVSAAYKGVLFRLATPPETITAVTGLVPGPTLERLGNKVITRDVYGYMTGEVPLTNTQTPITLPDDQKARTLTRELTKSSGDGQHIGIFKWVHNVLTDLPEDTDVDGPVSSEFRYLSATGQLWSASTGDPKIHYYYPEFAPTISAKGDRVLLIENSETHTQVKVYDQLGTLLLNEPSDIVGLLDARMAASGNCVLLNGYSTESTDGVPVYQVIEVASGKAWSATGPASTLNVLQESENSLGCFNLFAGSVLVLTTPQ